MEPAAALHQLALLLEPERAHGGAGAAVQVDRHGAALVQAEQLLEQLAHVDVLLSRGLQEVTAPLLGLPDTTNSAQGPCTNKL